MSAIDDLFRQLRKTGRKAFMPFVTAGDPDLEFTAQVIRRLVDRGASLCELGIPYSDPIADGPVIQESYTRALDAGVALDAILAMVRQWRTTSDMPLVTMISYSIVYRHGLEQYLRDASEAGVDGAIVPDLPVDEAGPLAEHARALDFKLIHLVTPITPHDRAERIARLSTGFIYYVSVAGITGERDRLPDELAEQVRWLRQHTDLPVCIGFGISRPEHVRMLRDVADGVIVGSALVRRLNQADPADTGPVLDQIDKLVRQLKQPLDNPNT